ncbi:MAG: hypothetical protein NC121_04090 [Blautia sp.]|nr:hypothetical protein [Blautia sp.]
MLEATFSPLVPTAESEEFYKNFYYQYSLIQVNDIIIRYTLECLSENQKTRLIDLLDNFNEDQKDAVTFVLAAGIMNPAVMRRRKENRGISTELFSSLKSKEIDALDWYEKAIEFLMIYAACEQAMKEYLVPRGNSSDSIKEVNIVTKLFKQLQDDGLREKFISELSESSSEILKSQNVLGSAWQYYTHIRNTLTHAGGRTTDRARKIMEDSIAKNKKEFADISAAMFLELDVPDEDNFFQNPLGDDIVELSDRHMNFFRNMAVLIVESLERTLHPSEYKIEDFDPYKL